MINHKVRSTYIKEIGFEGSKNGQSPKVKIVFHSGYEEIRDISGEAEYNKFKNAKSIGKHYNEVIKKFPVWRSK